MGTFAAVGCSDNVLELWNLEGPKLLSSEKRTIAGILALTFSQDSDELLLGQGGSNVAHARLKTLLSLLRRQFERALSRHEAPEQYLELCTAALKAAKDRR